MSKYINPTRNKVIIPMGNHTLTVYPGQTVDLEYDVARKVMPHLVLVNDSTVPKAEVKKEEPKAEVKKEAPKVEEVKVEAPKEVKLEEEEVKEDKRQLLIESPLPVAEASEETPFEKTIAEAEEKQKSNRRNRR
jgi:hypothetical protein